MSSGRLPPTVREAVTDFAQRLRVALGPSLLAVKVFGSHARGEGSPESDVDVFVLVRKRISELETAISDAAFETNLRFEVFIAPTVYGEEEFRNPVLRETPFLQAIDREGLPV